MKFENKGKWLQQITESFQKNEDRQEHFRFRLQTKDEREKVKNLDRLSNIKEKQGYYYVTFLAKTNSAGELAEYLRQNKIYPVDLLGVTDYTKESVTKANYNEILKALSDAIAKAAKKYPEAKLVKNYQATTGSTGAFLDEGLHFIGKDAVSKAIAVSKELQNVMNKYGFKNDIGGILPYMIGNNYHSAIVTFGSVSQGSNGASVGYHYMKDALKFLESAQINETRGYKVIVELGVPDNMNNRDIEDEVEKLLRNSHKIDVVIDVTAERQ